MFIPLCLVLGDSATCTETDAYDDLCYSRNQSAPICHNGACITCLELNINTPHFNEDEKICASCGELHYRVVDNQCVDSCPISAPVTVNHICRTCYEVNWRKPRWTGNKCDYCYDSYWDGEDCVAQCPEDAPKTYAGICYSCPGSLYFSPENRKCVSRCPDSRPSINSDNVCVTCFEKYPDYPAFIATAKNGEGVCYKCRDAADYSIYKGRKYQYLDKCYYSCPEIAPREVNYQCRPCENNLFFDPATKACVDTCPSETPAPSKDRYCKKCVDIDRTKPYWKDGMCKPCTEEDGGIFWTGSECATKCPRSRPILGENNICEACPDSEKYFY